MLPLAMIPTTLYAISADILRERLYDTQLAAVMQARRSLDAEARRYRTVAVMLTNEQMIQQLIDMDADDLRPTYALQFRRLRTLLGSTSAGTEGTESIILYLNKSDYAVDLARALPLQDVYKSLRECGLVGVDYAAWQRVVRARYSGEWIMLDVDGASRIYFAATLQGLYSDAAGTMLVALRKSYADGMLRPISGDETEWSAVCMEDGGMLYRSAEPPMALPSAWPAGDQGQYTEGGWLVSYVRSEVTGNLFVRAISERALLAPLVYLRNITFPLLFICFVACAVLSYYFAARNVNPLRQLVSLARGEQGQDEYAVLRAKLIEAAAEKRRLMNQSAMDERQKGDHAAYRALLACTDWRSLPLSGAAGGGYAMARVVLIDYTEPCAPADAMALIRDTFDFAPRPLWSSIAYQNGDSLLVLLRLAEPIDAALSDAHGSLRAAVQLVRDNFAADCLVGFSAPRREEGSASEKLHEMELETHAALHIMPAGESLTQYQADATLDRAFSRLLAACARTGDPEPALSAFAQEVRALLQRRDAPGPDAAGESAEYRLKRQVIAIVSQQYANPSLNVSMIASQLDRSADYVSKAFKQTTLIGLLDYIHHTRVKAARRLLVDRPDMTIAEVGAAVGYVSVDSFIRACKRIMDVTPGKYRENATAAESADSSRPNFPNGA